LSGGPLSLPFFGFMVDHDDLLGKKSA